MMKTKQNNSPGMPPELCRKIASFMNMKDLQDLATVSTAFSAETSEKRDKLKKIADELIKTDDEHIQLFLKEAHKNNLQWLLDYCYQSKVEDQASSMLDWAIKCYQSSKILTPLYNDATSICDSYFLKKKLHLAVEMENISMIKFLLQNYDNILEILESLTLGENTTAILKEVFPLFAAKLEGDAPIKLLKLALLDNNVEKAKIILKGAQSLPEMIKTQGEALFSGMSERVVLGVKLLHYWNEKAEKINSKNDNYGNLGKASFFHSLLAQSQGRKQKEDNMKIQLIEKLMKIVIQEDNSIKLTEGDFALIKNSKELNRLYNASLAISEGPSLDRVCL
jgi:hypothetical protein